jgi:PTH1 family peptidyl-tRNA hydrolase
VLKRLRARTKRPKPANSHVAHLVVGLRNPGADYGGTRHNVGAEVVERVLRNAAETAGRGPSRVRGMIGQLGAGEARTVLLLPNTYMNDSGGSVRSALDYFKVDPGDLLVIHDDIDLPFGRLRVQVGGGNGGHNGIRSLEGSLGTKDFSRLKLGVGRPPGSQDPADFVLRPFAKKERPEVDSIVSDAADVVELWVENRAKAQELAALRDKA